MTRLGLSWVAVAVAVLVAIASTWALSGLSARRACAADIKRADAVRDAHQSRMLADATAGAAAAAVSAADELSIRERLIIKEVDRAIPQIVLADDGSVSGAVLAWSSGIDGLRDPDDTDDRLHADNDTGGGLPDMRADSPADTATIAA